jgi:hypothetical protein
MSDSPTTAETLATLAEAVARLSASINTLIPRIEAIEAIIAPADSPAAPPAPPRATPAVASGSDAIRVYVKSLTGSLSLSIDTNLDETVLDLKWKVTAKAQIPVNHQRFIYAAHQIADDATLRSLSIPNEATIHVVIDRRD